MRSSTELAVAAFGEWVRRRFGGRVRQLAVYGSYARGRANEESDVDVLVVVDDLCSAEAREVAYAAGDAMTHHDVLLSPLVVSTQHIEDLRQRGRSIVQAIDREAIPL